MMYNGYYFWGMDLVWWIIWMVMLFWIFAIPYNIPYQRMPRTSHLDILQKRLALGEITTGEYQERKKILENDKVK